MDWERQKSIRGCCGRKGWISTWFMEGLTFAYLRRDAIPDSVKLERPIDFARPAL